MITSIDEQLFTHTGDAEVGVFIANLAGWTKLNATKENPAHRNFHDGRFWSYNTYTELQRYFGAWSIRTIRVIIQRAIKLGLVIKGNFNKKTYDNTNWYALTDKALSYYPVLNELVLNTPVKSDRPPVKSDRPIPLNNNSLSKNNIISVLENTNEGIQDVKSDYYSNQGEGTKNEQMPVDTADLDTKSDYQNNQIKKCAVLSKSEQYLGSPQHNSRRRANANLIAQIVDSYHEILPNCPKIKVVDSKFTIQLTNMINNWPKYQKEGKEFTIQSFKDYLNYLNKFHSFLVKPYTTETGNVRCNNLRVLTREIVISKVVNGEYSVN